MADNLPEPASRKETYLAKAAGMAISELPEPASREEEYLNAIAENGGGGGGGTSNFNQLTNRPKYNGTTMTGSTNIPRVVNTAFVGTTGTSAGTAGLVPAPATTDAGKFLKADGTWDTAGGGGGADYTVLTTADYNWNSTAGDATTTPFDCVAMWLMPAGNYQWDISIQPVTVILDPSGTTVPNEGMLGSFIFTRGANQHFEVPDQGVEADIIPIITYNAGQLYDEYSTYSGRIEIVNGNIEAKIYLNNRKAWNSVTVSAGDDANYIPLSASMGKYLNDETTTMIKRGAGAPTTSTAGTVGRLYEDTTNGKLYICTAVSGSTYTWEGVGGSFAKTLTTDDYNYKSSGSSVNDKIALWLLEPGFYYRGNVNAQDIYSSSNRWLSNETKYYYYLVLKDPTKATIYAFSTTSTIAPNIPSMLYWRITLASPESSPTYYKILDSSFIEDTLTSNSSSKALSANQGKILNDNIGDVTTLTTTAKTSTVAAINELDSEMPIITVTSTDPGEGSTLAEGNFIAVYGV